MATMQIMYQASTIYGLHAAARCCTHLVPEAATVPHAGGPGSGRGCARSLHDHVRVCALVGEGGHPSKRAGRGGQGRCLAPHKPPTPGTLGLLALQAFTFKAASTACRRC